MRQQTREEIAPLWRPIDLVTFCVGDQVRYARQWAAEHRIERTPSPVIRWPGEDDMLIATTTTLTISPDSVPAGWPVTFTVTVTPASSAPQPVSGGVRLESGTTHLASLLLPPDGSGVVTWTTTHLAPGSYNVTAIFEFGGIYDRSTSAAVPLTVAPTTPTSTASSSLAATRAASGGFPQATATTPPGYELAWGDNVYGEVGDGTTVNRNVPVFSSLPPNVLVTGTDGGYSFSLAVASTGQALAWGYNSYGQLGNGSTTNSDVPVPVLLPSDTTVTAVSAGAYHALALTSTGTVLAWGANWYGQLGNGTFDSSLVPVPVSLSLPVGVTITAIAAGAYHSLALASNGTMLAWGANWYGQLGNGDTSGTNQPTPVPVSLSLPTGVTVTAIAAGGAYSLALTSDGTVLAWGANWSGQLGNGDTSGANQPTPVPVSLPPGTIVKAIDAGGAHSLAVTSNNGLLTWGDNSSGQLGDGTHTSSYVPVPISLPGTTITEVAGGDYYSLAMTSTGHALGWGDNSYGQVGDGTFIQRTSPVAVSLPGDTTINTIAAGGVHSLAINALTPTTTLLTQSLETTTLGQPVTFTATITPDTARAEAPTGTVYFYDDNGSTLLGSAPVAPNGRGGGIARFTTTNLGVGTHHISAHYGSDVNFEGSDSNTVDHVVGQAYAAVVLNESPSSVTPGQPVTFFVDVIPPAGAGGFVPTGTVRFNDGTAVLGSATLNNGTAVFTTTLPSGTHVVTATYLGDTNYLGGLVSSPVLVAVNAPKASTNTALTVVPLSPRSGQTVTMTATVTAVAPATGTPTGTVSFYDGTTLLNTATLDPSGVATYSTSALSIGTHSIKAVYNGDSNFLSSTSSTLPVTVTP
ncbi:Ig-like domain repeat protein [Amycolatopsis cynarae]|uniref:Ig-like domain repeat protein n=1 Tax=Amycolatopsis cynarae TaxID=2995223 RepID=A0ABY7B2Y5_9PSEU|nr:Ig-like domain repeat protein [Amycolatopsis sp. HUAS 11-8]WAL66546.1 Ig-like domain repeat protein [Amycolatopsis sp. HUAS 11-8]